MNNDQIKQYVLWVNRYVELKYMAIMTKKGEEQMKHKYSKVHALTEK